MYIYVCVCVCVCVYSNSFWQKVKIFHAVELRNVSAKYSILCLIKFMSKKVKFRVKCN